MRAQASYQVRTPDAAVMQRLSDDEWQRRATAAAITQARKIAESEAINPRAAIGSLSDIEWGWIATAIIAGWIFTKAEQATSEGLPCEDAIRAMGGVVPDPWQAGAVASCLSALASVDGFDWSKPLGEWGKDEIVTLMWHSHQFVDAALACRDEGGRDNVARYLQPADVILPALPEDEEIPF